jgi:hypothetical protein
MLNEQLFQIREGKNACVGVNRVAEENLNSSWLSLEGENYQDGRVNWLLHVLVIPNDESTPDFSREQAVNIANRFCAPFYGWSCERFMYEPREMSFVILLQGIREYNLNELVLTCKKVINLQDCRIVPVPLYGRASYNIALSYINAAGKHYPSNH